MEHESLRRAGIPITGCRCFHLTREPVTAVSSVGLCLSTLLAVVLALLTRLGLDVPALALLWSLVTLAAVMWMGYELNLTLRGSRDWTGALLFAAACLGVSLAIYDLYLGQADLLLAVLAVVSCALWLRRISRAALPLGIAVAIKPTLAILLLIWLWKGDWRAALRGAIIALALVLLPFAVIGGDGLRDYFTFMTQWNGLGENSDVVNQTPFGMPLRLFTSPKISISVDLLPVFGPRRTRDSARLPLRDLACFRQDTR